MKKMLTTRALKLCLWLCAQFLVVSQINAQVLSEGFEGTFPPSGWLVTDNGIGTGNNWTSSTNANTGSGAAFTNYDCTVASNSEDWLITPLVAISPGNNIIEYAHRQTFTTDYGSIYEVRVSTTSQTNLASFVSIDTLTEAQVPLAYAPYSVDLSAYNGQSIYIAFVHTQDCGDDYYVDDVLIGTPPCTPAAALAAANPTQNSIDLNWTSSSGLSEVSVVPAGSPPSGGPLSTTGSATVGGLMGATGYDAFVRDICEGGSPLLITGVFDGPLSGGQPKAIELYAQDSISDLSIYAVGSANNGGGTTAPLGEFSLPSQAVSSGTFIYITSDSADFVTYFGFSADFEDAVAFINGDDAVELVRGGQVIDVFGVDTVDGTGQTWEYLDGWAYRNNNTGANGGVFVDSSFTYSGINAVDGCSANGTCSSSWPIGTYQGVFDASIWVGPVPFATLCPPVIAPWEENFDGNQIPLCWTDSITSDPWRFNTGAGWEAGNAGDHTGNNGNYAWLDASFHDDGDVAILFSPFIITDSLTTPEAYYYIYSRNTNDTTVYNELLVDVWDGAAWNRIDSIKEDLGAAWVERTANLSSLNITGPVQLRFTNTGEFGSSFYNDILIDDVGVRELPTCPNPTNIVIDSITDTSAVVLFNSVAPGDTFFYSVVPFGMAPMPPYSQASGSPIALTGLMPNTVYEFYLQEFCGVGDSSAFLGPFPFTTACPPSPTADSAADAEVIASLPFSGTGSTVCNTDVIGNPSSDYWYVVTVDPCATDLDVSLCGSFYDTFLRILDDSLNPVASNDDNGPACSGTASSISTPVMGGGTYYIVVEGFSTNNGSYLIDVNQTLAPAPDASFNYMAASYCEDSMIIAPVITGDSGGVFTASAGLVIDSVTGAIAIDMPGSYVVSYTVGMGTCMDTDTFAVTVNAQEVADISYPVDSVCGDAGVISVTNNGTTGGTFNSLAALALNTSTGEIDPSGSMPGTYSVEYTTGGACADTGSTTITIVAAQDPTFFYPADTFCLDSMNPTPGLVTGGGVFSSTPGLVFTAADGTIDLTNTPVGTYTITYDLGGFCPANSSLNITIISCAVGLYDRLDDVSMYQVYPNPNTGRFNLVSLGVDKQVQVQVTDLEGRIILDQNAELIQGLPTQFDIGDVSVGTYFLRVVDGEKTANYKLYIHRN